MQHGLFAIVVSGTTPAELHLYITKVVHGVNCVASVLYVAIVTKMRFYFNPISIYALLIAAWSSYRSVCTYPHDVVQSQSNAM